MKTTYIQLADRVPGLLYQPDTMTEKSRICILVMHSDENYLSFPTGVEMAKRGYQVLCANVMLKEGFFFTQPEKMQAVKAAVEYLRGREDVGKIILMGHSGGATLMTAYQNIAENGVQVFQGKEKIVPHPDCGELPPADGLMLFDANWGNAVMQLFSLDPSVTDEYTGKNLDEKLNLFNPENGFNPAGSHYPDDFIHAFQKAQGERNMRVLNAALKRYEAIKAGEGLYADDEPLTIPGAAQSVFNNKLFPQDTRLMAHTQEPHKLVHPDGSVTEEIVYSVREPESFESRTNLLADGAREMTVKNYLTSYAIRTFPDYGYDDSSVWGIDWESSYNSPISNIPGIRVPLLCLGMTGGWEFLASESIYNHADCADKSIAFIDGANHRFYPVSDRYGDTIKTLHDYADSWIQEEGRFL